MVVVQTTCVQYSHPRRAYFNCYIRVLCQIWTGLNDSELPDRCMLSIGGNKVIIQILILQSLDGETYTYCAIISISVSAIRFSKTPFVFY